MKHRTLSLRTEHLAELTTSELTSVAGASGLPCDLLTGACPTWDCTGCHITCGCAADDR
ncbi:MAG TPA: hypothetical protein VNA20_15185 [Frankiaceae bacterium]|nr:hypothetical protein [Frankiaceae bacterium]